MRCVRIITPNGCVLAGAREPQLAAQLSCCWLLGASCTLTGCSACRSRCFACTTHALPCSCCGGGPGGDAGVRLSWMARRLSWRAAIYSCTEKASQAAPGSVLISRQPSSLPDSAAACRCSACCCRQFWRRLQVCILPVLFIFAPPCSLLPAALLPCLSLWIHAKPSFQPTNQQADSRWISHCPSTHQTLTVSTTLQL